MSKKSRPTRAQWARIRLLALDVDGILTDGSVYIASDGTETKRYSIIDGLGMVMLRKLGVEVAWISGRASGSTTLRAAELKIPHLIQGKHDKLTALTELAGRLGFDLSQCAYMGDDFIDAPAIAAAGIGITVPTALASAIKAARYVTRRNAGAGAVREVCDLLIEARFPKSGNLKDPRFSLLP